MGEYKQMEFNVELDQDRDLKENVQVALEFACNQLKSQGLPEVTSRQEGYGIVAEHSAALSKTSAAVTQGMKGFLSILASDDDSAAVSEATKVYNAACETAFRAIRLAAEAHRVAEDLYHKVTNTKTPIEEYIDQQEAKFEPAEEAKEEDGAAAEGMPAPEAPAAPEKEEMSGAKRAFEKARKKVGRPKKEEKDV